MNQSKRRRSPTGIVHYGRLSLFLLCVSWLCVGSGCTVTRGGLYLRTEPVQDYLARENVSKKCQNARAGSFKKEQCQLVDGALVQARTLLKKVPDAARQLGGFCTKPEIVRELRKIQDQAPTCREKLKKYQSTSNLNGIVFWSLMGGTAATGAAMILGGLFGPDNGAKVGLALGFGIPMTLAALTNTIGPFSRNYDLYRDKATRIDNYMWTLRIRISIEVCNASNFFDAYDNAKRIAEQATDYCTGRQGDGIFKPETK